MQKDSPAFPIQHTINDRVMDGLTARAYAAIHLGVPDSGVGWLDDMIRASKPYAIYIPKSEPTDCTEGFINVEGGERV